MLVELVQTLLTFVNYLCSTEASELFFLFDRTDYSIWSLRWSMMIVAEIKTFMIIQKLNFFTMIIYFCSMMVNIFKCQEHDKMESSDFTDS